jgi:NADH-quinone oxidoreductase subunit M
MPELHLPWLELSIAIPLLGGVVAARMRHRERTHRLSLVVCLLTMLCTVGEWWDFSALRTFEAHDHWDVIEWAFHSDVLVVDELSAPLPPLVSLLHLLIVGSTLRTKVHRFSFAGTLISEAIVLATLSCRAPWVLIALLAAATVPPWMELRSRGRSTRVYTIHQATFVSLLIAGQLLVDASLSGSSGAIIGGALLTIATLLRSGVIPLHCWMTDLFEKATLGTALLFVTPMTGAYALMRLVLPIAPDWALQSIAIVSLVTSVYAGGMALVQHEARRFFCYLFLSHSSLVLVGLELVTPIGLAGGLCVWLSVGLSLAGFGITLRCVESRIGRISLDEFHGLHEHTPTLATLFLMTGLASIGFPGTIGFIGTELLIEGAVGVYPLTGTAVVLAAALNGIAILLAYFRIFTGTRHVTAISLRAKWSERIAVLILATLIFGGGLFPQPGVSSRYHAAAALLARRDTEIDRTDHEAIHEQTGASESVNDVQP